MSTCNLETRMRVLERSNRRWRLWAASVPLVFFGLGAATATNIVCDRLRAKSLEIWDKDRGGLVVDVEKAINELRTIESRVAAIEARSAPPRTPASNTAITAATAAEVQSLIRRLQEIQSLQNRPDVEKVRQDRRQRVYGALLALGEAKTEADALSAIARAKEVIYGE